MLRFTFLGFPVSIHWMFWLVAFLWGNHTQGDSQALMLWIAAFFLSIFWHELGHAFLYRHYGARPSISLHGIGGTCYGHGYTPIGNHRLKEILISFAGPAFGLALAAAAWLIIRQLTGKAPEFSLYSGTTPLLKFATYLFVINLFLNLLNLLPVLPLDGGQIMQAILGPTSPSSLRFSWSSTRSTRNRFSWRSCLAISPIKTT